MPVNPIGDNDSEDMCSMSSSRAAEKHATESHPEWEYVTCRAKVGETITEIRPSGEGWERNTARSSVGHWMRPRTKAAP